MATPAEVPRGAEINGLIGKPLYPPTLVANAFSEHWQTAAVTIAYPAIGGTRVGHRLRHSPSVPRHRRRGPIYTASRSQVRRSAM